MLRITLAAFSVSLFFSFAALAQYDDDITSGEAQDTPYNQEVEREFSNEWQKEKRLEPNELGGPSRSSSDYIYGTRDRNYERDDGGTGGEYSREDFYKDGD